MRALRRIVGDPRFSDQVPFNDAQVRRLLCAPSIDCLIAKQRLRYLGRIVRTHPRGLIGLLHIRAGEKRLAWVKLVANDCELLKTYESLPSSLPHMFVDSGPWLALMRSEPQWTQAVDRLHFCESVSDRQHGPTHSPARILAYPCTRCNKAFASQMALEAHCRRLHGDRLDLRRYVASSVCPACGTDYHERLRCISDLSHKRQPKCAVWIRALVEPLPDAEVARLDAIDRVLRREPWRQGHTHHIAVRPSIRPKTATRRGKHAVQSGA